MVGIDAKRTRGNPRGSDHEAFQGETVCPEPLWVLLYQWQHVLLIVFAHQRCIFRRRPFALRAHQESTLRITPEDWQELSCGQLAQVTMPAARYAMSLRCMQARPTSQLDPVLMLKHMHA